MFSEILTKSLILCAIIFDLSARCTDSYIASLFFFLFDFKLIQQFVKQLRKYN